MVLIGREAAAENSRARRLRAWFGFVGLGYAVVVVAASSTTHYYAIVLSLLLLPAAAALPVVRSQRRCARLAERQRAPSNSAKRARSAASMSDTIAAGCSPSIVVLNA